MIAPLPSTSTTRLAKRPTFNETDQVIMQTLAEYEGNEPSNETSRLKDLLGHLLPRLPDFNVEQVSQLVNGLATRIRQRTGGKYCPESVGSDVCLGIAGFAIVSQRVTEV